MRNRITGISKRVLGQRGTKLGKKLRRKEASAKQRPKTTVHFIYLVIMICLSFLLMLRYQDMTQQFTQHFKLINSKNPRNVKISRNNTPIDTTFQVDQLKKFGSINSKNFSDKTYARWSATSKVQFDENRTFVWKPITKYKKYDVLDREVCILNHLSNFSWAPKLLWHNSSGLVTNYLGGEPLSAYKIPLDYKEQLQKIVDDMKSVGINHGDIYKRCHPKCDTKKKENENYDVMVQEESGKTFASLSLIDFGWATSARKICPTALGSTNLTTMIGFFSSWTKHFAAT